jgi:hypothetical protein
MRRLFSFSDGSAMLSRCAAFSLFFLISSCAIKVPPTGGDKDVTPPEVKKSTPENFSTGFTGQDINIVFDEYIELKELNTQLIVSPPLNYPPDARVKKKTLRIQLEDTLQPNTTYTMNFGNAITDIREGNAIADFQYVFSTGEVIDSLKISGTAENGIDKKTEKGIYVMLYRGVDDSLPMKKIPDYFAKTAEDGSFEIKNVSPGTYKVFALKETNSNYLFDNTDETIAFSEAVKAGDTAKVNLRLFKEEKKQQLLKASSEEPGMVLIVYAHPLAGETITFLSDTASLEILSMNFSPKRDTIVLWYSNTQADSLNFILQNQISADTVTLRLKKPGSKGRSTPSAVLTTQYTYGAETPLDLNRPLELAFNHPVDSFDFSRISLTEDSVAIKDVKYSFSDSLRMRLAVEFPRKEKTTYALEIPSATFRDIFMNRNDSMKVFFRTKSTSDYGTMAVTISSASPGKNFIVQLIDDKEVVYRESNINTDTTISYDFLDPRSYRLKIIEDLNGNKEWDTGNYLEHVQPERVFYYKESLTVRANWDVEVKWEFQGMQN